MTRSFGRYLWMLLAACILLSILIPFRTGVRYPRPLGPQFDESYRRDSLRAITIKRPQIVMVGDSVFMRGVDLQRLAEGTGKSVSGIGVAGSASALWYAIVAYHILPSPHKPELLLIVFRDTMLTTPGYRVQGSYREQLDEYAPPDDALLNERAYINLMNPLEKIAERYFPLYGSRLDLRETLDRHLRYRANGLLLGCDERCVNIGMGIVFGAANLEPNILGDAIGTAEDYLYTPQALNFDCQLNRSFLPEIVRLAREKGMRLVLIRAKTMRYPTEESEPLALKIYMQKLSAYLAANDVVLLDFGQDPRLKPEYFYDPLHLNEEGRLVFTALIVNALNALPAK